MTLVVLVAVSLTIGAAAFLAARRLMRRAVIRSRLEPGAEAGPALAIALLAVIGGGVVLGIMTELVRASGTLAQLDAGIARWGHDHTGPVSARGLNDVTALAATPWVIAIAVVVGAIEMARVPSRWIPPFLVVVIVGDSLATNAVKHLIERARPTLDPLAERLGPSFPSGHSSTAAALFAALALLAGRRRGPRVRALLAGSAVGLAVAVAGSRVLLDLHWTSDVVAGLALGWAWFAASAIAFGGRILRPGAGVEAAAKGHRPARPGSRRTAAVRRSQPGA